MNKLKELTDDLEEDVNDFNDAKDNYSDAKDKFQKNKSMMHWRLTKNHAEDMVSEAFAIKSSREDLVDYVDNTNGVPIPEKPTSNQEIKNKIDDLIENDLRPACSDFKKLDNQKFKPLLSDYKSGEIENKYKVDTWEDLNGFAEDLKSKTSTIYGIVREVKNLEDKLSTSGSCSGSSSGYDLSGIIPDKAEKINQQGSSYDFGIGEKPEIDNDFSHINDEDSETWTYGGGRLKVKSVASWAETIASNFLNPTIAFAKSIIGEFENQSGTVDIKPSPEDTMEISTKIQGTKDGKINVDVNYKFRHEDTKDRAGVPDVTVTKEYDDITWEYNEERSKAKGKAMFEYQGNVEDIETIYEIYNVKNYQGEDGM